jgi:DNA-binding XRE family transcriptional regulator
MSAPLVIGGTFTVEEAMMGKPQIIHTDGEDLVILKRSDYEALLARAGDDDAEDTQAARLLDRTDARIARGEDVALPTEIWEAIEAGENPVRVIRKYRGLTQTEVAAKTGLAQGFIADIEAGKKTGSAASLKAIADALAVPLDILVE